MEKYYCVKVYLRKTAIPALFKAADIVKNIIVPSTLDRLPI